ncbi:hypothetical protein PanWU01x14_149820 [Parasponia andersonii]|uniref:Uncharacterized protein n=1 Tax=Parasponia andersonii TaxID=3476 RepID=A0A2P5CIJ2_PARAD|nr:hypothetical protein PanWU01x14_149820 [Parasponia andersonii]
MKPTPQVMPKIEPHRRYPPPKIPPLVDIFGYWSFVRSSFVIPLEPLDLSHRRHHFSTGLGR